MENATLAKEPITGDMLIGKVRTVIWPLSEIRGVE